MANNRMYLRHKITGNIFDLASKGSNEWCLWSRKDLSYEMNLFFEDHLVQDQGLVGSNYEIVYEIEDSNDKAIQSTNTP